MLLKKNQIPIFAIMICAIMIFAIIFSSRKNYEFLMYIGVIILFLIIVLFTNKKVRYPNSLLWGLTVWAILHMSGGGLYIGGKKLYEAMLIPIIGEPYNIFRYDQFVHMVGFGVATLLMYYLIRPILKEDHNKWVSLSIVVIMAGFGVGAFNEFVEFIATLLMPETGVGGYINTSLDLVADLIGACLAMIFILTTVKNTNNSLT